MFDLQKRKRSGRRWFRVCVLAFLGVAGLSATPGWGQAIVATQPAGPYGIQIGRETTYLTEPLLADGMVDYAEAINAQTSKGVTPGNNAACLIARIVRADAEKWSTVPEEMLARLGVDPKATKATWTDSPEKLDEVIKARGATSRPWKRAEMPEVSAWLASNQAALDLFAEASRRSEWWAPARSHAGGSILDVGDSGLWRSARSPAIAMWVRSMLKLGEGDEAGAWKDLAACVRMAGLMGTSPNLAGRLVAAGIHQGTMAGLWGMIEHGELSREVLQPMDALLHEQRRWPTGGEVIPQSDRYQSLMLVAYFAKGMQEAWDKNEGGLREQFQAAGSGLPDWNRIMRMVNSVYDMLQADQKRMSADERAEYRRLVNTRMREMAVIKRDSKSDMRADATMGTTWLMPRVGETQDAYADRVGAVVIMLMPPAPERMAKIFDGCNAQAAWTRVAAALVRYRQDRGGYPADLKALLPVYAAALPEDGGERPVRYERTAKGFVLTNEVAGESEAGWERIVIRRER